MVSVGKKQIAMFLIMLLTGHEVAEAARIHNARRSRAAGFESKAEPLPADQDVEAVWQAENGKCGSKYLFWCSKGPKNPNEKEVHRCAKQPLTGDVRGSNEVCRVSDEWMLAGTPEKPSSWWLSVQIKLLKAKTAKLVESCGKSNPKYNKRKCNRRMQHVLRAIKFIGKASKSGTFGELTSEQMTEAQDAANDAREKIGEVMVGSPQKREQINRLVEALKKDQNGLQKAPKATIKRTLDVLQNNILPDDADPTVAEEEIHKLELEAKPADPEDTEAFDARMEELEADVAGSPSDLGDTFDDTIQEMEEEMEDGVVEAEDEEAQGNSTQSSLMQRRYGDTAVKVVAFVVIAVLIVLAIKFAIAVIWGLLVFWIVASIFGCSIAAYSGDKFTRTNPQGQVVETSRTRFWGGCVVKWISYPFVLVWHGLKWVFSDKKNKKSSLAQIHGEALALA